LLDDVQDIFRRVGALLDDPSNSRFSGAYLTPFIDQEYDEMDVQLEVLGMEYVEHIAIVNVNANVTDLSYLLADGQALQSMKLPKRVDWKQQGQPDTSYIQSSYVDELDDVGIGSIGFFEWTFQQGSLQVTPSSVPITARIYFDATSTNIYDPAQGVIRGTGHILAPRVAAYVASLQNGMGTLQKKAETKAKEAWLMFCKLVVMNSQSKLRSPRPIHRRTWPMGMPTPPSA
jgi:hypothetical protein